LFIDDGYLAMGATVYWMSTYMTGVALNMCNFEEEESTDMECTDASTGMGKVLYLSISYVTRTGVVGIGCQHLVSQAGSSGMSVASQEHICLAPDAGSVDVLSRQARLLC
jgi:hypothetical protein